MQCLEEQVNNRTLVRETIHLASNSRGFLSWHRTLQGLASSPPPIMYPSLNAPWLFIKWQLVKCKINLLVPREWFVITLPGKALAGLWNLCEGWLRAVCPWFSWGLSQQSKSVFSSSRPQPLWLTSTDPYKYAGLKVFKNALSVM